MKMPKGPFCQSCAMPMHKPEQFGTEAGGEASQDYCCHCRQDGKFTAPDITMQQMQDKVASMLKGIPPAEARKIADSFIPKLKRWRNRRADNG